MFNKYPIYKTIVDFYASFENSRYKSWEHCFLFFRNNIYCYIGTNINNEIEDKLDLASLHLGFYLASWGMMRGSSFLLQYDYKIHINLIKHVLLDKKYALLWDFNFNTSTKSDVDNFVYSIQKIKTAIVYEYPDVKNSRGAISKPSDTLVTKILMGTLGCIPAYDRYFMDGLLYAQKFDKSKINFTQRFGHDSILSIIEFLKININEISQANNDLKLNYPLMKLVDMYFWTIGFKEAQERNRNAGTDRNKD